MSRSDWATWIAAGAAVATAVIYVVLGVVAYVQVREARRLREEQARPFVVVDFEPGFLIYITVANTGRTMARDVRITFDKPLQTSLVRPSEIDESPLFREPILMMAPGKRIRVLFDSFPDRLKTDLSATYDVRLEYRGITKKLFKDHYRLDLSMYLGSSPPEKGIPDLVLEVEKIRMELAKWTEANRGLLVRTIDHDRKQRRDWRPIFRRQAAEVRRSQGVAAYVRWHADKVLRRHGWK